MVGICLNLTVHSPQCPMPQNISENSVSQECCNWIFFTLKCMPSDSKSFYATHPILTCKAPEVKAQIQYIILFRFNWGIKHLLHSTFNGFWCHRCATNSILLICAQFYSSAVSMNSNYSINVTTVASRFTIK